MNISASEKSTKINSFSAVRQHLTKRDINECLSFYGFIECAEMCRFLAVLVDDDLDVCSYRYLLACLNECLQTHVNGYKDEGTLSYFQPLIKLRDEIEFITSISFS